MASRSRVPPGNNSGWPPEAGRKAEYMYDLLQSIALVARRHHPDLMRDLIYFIEMAALEADSVRRKSDDE
ncbi:MAG: hypothetical protein ACFB6R_06525 [Alphaproteobacteria bacterium]